MPIEHEVPRRKNVIRVQGNIIGIDRNGNEAGVCGIGISALGKTSTTSGKSVKLLENTIVRSRKGFEEAESDVAIYLGGSRGITVQGNIVRNAASKVVGFSTGVADVWRNFRPAQITNVDGTSISPIRVICVLSCRFGVTSQ